VLDQNLVRAVYVVSAAHRDFRDVDTIDFSARLVRGKAGKAVTWAMAWSYEDACR
jgi:hypothetical protein